MSNRERPSTNKVEWGSSTSPDGTTAEWTRVEPVATFSDADSGHQIASIAIAALVSLPLATFSLLASDSMQAEKYSMRAGLGLAFVTFAAVVWGANAFLDLRNELQKKVVPPWYWWLFVSLSAVVIGGTVWGQLDADNAVPWKISFWCYLGLLAWSVGGLVLGVVQQFTTLNQASRKRFVFAVTTVSAFVVGTFLQFSTLWTLDIWPL